MKLQKITFAIASLLRVARNEQHYNESHNQPNVRRRRLEATTNETNSKELLKSYGKIMSSDIRKDVCIELPVPKETEEVVAGTPLRLGDCAPHAFGWRFDHDGKIHSQWNDKYCIQAGSKAVHEGALLHLYPCDDNVAMQRFVYAEDRPALRPRFRHDLCVTWWGKHADVGVDPLVLRHCDSIEYQRHWMGDFPRAEDDRSGFKSSHESYDAN